MVSDFREETVWVVCVCLNRGVTVPEEEAAEEESEEEDSICC